ncbi:MAG: NAD(P)H-dependent oxidoreductase [Myxococcales bacterium]|nr:NAD(P)H-dependent oxidoreductase [Myxococcales bacterium]
MRPPLKILAIPGSLRARSLNRAALVAMHALAPDNLSLEIYPLDDVPLYNGDLDLDGGPAPVRAFKEAIAAADGLLIATPEYNYGVPGVLKNALDWASRPAYRSPLAHKPVALLGAAASVVGSARAQGQLKQVLLGMLSEVFPYPEVVIGGAHQRFDGDLRLTDEATREHLGTMLRAYGEWLARRV